MEARKVQRVGRSTLSVSLPNEWAKIVGLKPGDQITFIENKDGTLTLQPLASTLEAAQVEYIINADMCTEPGILERVIVGNYLNGRDTMRIVSARGISAAHIEETRRIVRRLLGMGIIEETPNQILIQCSIDITKFPVNSLVRRLYIIASTMFKEALTALEQLNIPLAKQALSREEEADMLYWLLTRLVFISQSDRKTAVKIGLEEPLHILGARAVGLLLERSADWGETIAKNVIELENAKSELEAETGKKIVGKIVELGKIVNEICYNGIQSLYSGDILTASRSIELYKRKVETMEEEIVNELPLLGLSAYVCQRLRTITWGAKRTAELGAEIAQIAINRSLEVNSKYCEAHIIKEEATTSEN
jgi:phosphate uptake regulator